MVKCFVAVYLIWIGVITTALAHTPSDPNFAHPEIFQDWKTLHTPHFNIHHLAAHQAYAQQMAAMAERVHTRLSGWLGWQPQEPTEVVIMDSVDFSNGGASPLPYNRFYIFMPTPVEAEFTDHNPWMEMVFTHEYVHILQLDMASGGPGVMRNIFGRPINLFSWAFFPQIFAPSWVTEGLAVYGESDNDRGYGRLNSAWYEAQMRMEVQRGLRSLTEISFEGYSGSRWPYGQIYLYGAYFFKFIEERYGRENVKNYIAVYGGNIIPWRMDKRARQIFGKPAKQVWAEFQDYLKQRFEPQLAALKQQATITTHTVYDAPYTNAALAAAGNGDVYFFHDSASSHPEIRRLRADGTSASLFDVSYILNLDWQDQSGLLLSQFAVCDNNKLYADLYRWQPGMSAPERMTHCGRYPRAAWRPDGQAIAAVQLEQGLSRLVLLDAQGKNFRLLAELPLGDAIGNIAWSPDNNSLVASVKRLQTGWNLELFDVNNQRWKQLTLNNDLEVQPHFSRDGSAIYFISDHGKIWNLRRIKLGSTQVETLSNTVSGITEAVEMPDNSYRLVEYTANGDAITALPSVKKAGTAYAARSTPAPKVKAVVTASDYQPYPYQDVQDYSALTTLRPRSWFPLIDKNEDKTSFVGVTVNGADVLGFHEWNITPLHYYEQKALGGFAAYNFYNKFLLSAQRQFLINGNVKAPVRYRDDELRYQALLNHSFNSLDASLYLAMGVASEKITTTVFKGAGLNQQSRDTISGAIARYDSTEYYRRSISLVDGRRIQLTGESYDGLGKSDHTGRTARLDWSEYFGLGANHALQLRAQGARGDSGIRPYLLGGATETFNKLGGETGLGRRDFPLRGYPSGLASLSGTRFAIGTVEWRIPLGLHYDGWFVPPLGLGRHSLSVFADRGDAWSPGETRQLKTGAGLEWNAETLIGYDLLHLSITLGYAHGFDQEGKDQLYFRLGLPL
ncbi:MAG: hypothetical protein Q7S51_10610 [Gallionellaceae bacterium]|nr:hypothetical protein [Gallionellaceae bacterium]